MSEASRITTALWVLQSYLLDQLWISPRLGICSPVMRCGETTLLDVLERLTRRAKMAADISPASIFRVVEAYQPTLLIDEADTFLAGNGRHATPAQQWLSARRDRVSQRRRARQFRGARVRDLCGLCDRHHRRVAEYIAGSRGRRRTQAQDPRREGHTVPVRSNRALGRAGAASAALGRR